MLPFSFTITPNLRDSLIAIDDLRRTVLTTTISPRVELKLRFTATVNRIYGSLLLARLPVSKHDVTTFITNPPKKPTTVVASIVAYRNALLYLSEAWTGNPKPVTANAIETLVALCYPNNRSMRQSSTALEQTIRRIIELTDPKNDHPVIQGAVSHAMLTDAFSGSSDRGQIARLVSTLIFMKFGLDLRGMLALESEWVHATDSYMRAFETIERHGELSAWLLYYAQTTLTAMEKLRELLSSGASELHADLPKHFFDLTERQKQILALVESPTASITNRDIQKRFTVSQITASRDLSKLTSLNLLYPRGKGRSVNYTRA